jgi:CheY-like chemotaxis protein
MPRILMIDNAELFRALEASFLRRAGWEIVRARDGKEILERARQRPPDIVLLDTTGPPIDAPACVAAVKKDAALRNAAVVILADPSSGAAHEGLGADAIVIRPVEPAALEAILCRFGAERPRTDRRRAVRSAARVTSAYGACRARLKDISRTGLFLALPQPIPVDTALELRLSLTDRGGTHAVSARGTVVRRVEDDPGSHLIAGVGVRFTGFEDDAASIIENFVEHEVTHETGQTASHSLGWRADAADRHGGG